MNLGDAHTDCLYPVRAVFVELVGKQGGCVSACVGDRCFQRHWRHALFLLLRRHARAVLLFCFASPLLLLSTPAATQVCRCLYPHDAWRLRRTRHRLCRSSAALFRPRVLPNPTRVGLCSRRRCAIGDSCRSFASASRSAWGREGEAKATETTNASLLLVVVPAGDAVCYEHLFACFSHQPWASTHVGAARYSAAPQRPHVASPSRNTAARTTQPARPGKPPAGPHICGQRARVAAVASWWARLALVRSGCHVPLQETRRAATADKHAGVS